MCDNTNVLFIYFVGTNGRTHMLTPQVEDKIVGHMSKLVNIVNKPIILYRYEVHDMQQQVSVIDLMQQTCECRKYQLSQISCTHIAIVAQFNNLLDCFQWASVYNSTKYLQEVFKENINLVEDQSTQARSTNLPMIYLSTMQKRGQVICPTMQRGYHKEKKFNNVSVVDVINMNIVN